MKGHGPLDVSKSLSFSLVFPRCFPSVQSLPCHSNNFHSHTEFIGTTVNQIIRQCLKSNVTVVSVDVGN